MFRLRPIVFLLMAASAALAQMPYPKPQIASAEGQPAPDFTLKDQNGRDFHLAAHGGQRLLLVFYRGHW